MKWRFFQFHEINEAYAWAAEGNAAVHDTGFPFRRWKLTAHLLCGSSRLELEEAATVIGVDLRWIQQRNVKREMHYDIFGAPLTKALKLIDNPQHIEWEERAA